MSRARSNLIDEPVVTESTHSLYRHAADGGKLTDIDVKENWFIPETEWIHMSPWQDLTTKGREIFGRLSQTTEYDFCLRIVVRQENSSVVLWKPVIQFRNVNEALLHKLSTQNY